MPTKRTRPRQAQTYLQSEGNLALADESLGIHPTRKAETQARKLRLVAKYREEASDADALVPATGMIVGVGLSMTLWSLIFLAWYWMRVSL